VQCEGWLKRAGWLAPVLLLVAAGAGLRFYSLGFLSLWLDEVTTAQAIRFPDLGSVLAFVGRDPSATPLKYVVTWLVRPIGIDEFAIRVPYAIAGLLAVIATCALAARRRAPRAAAYHDGRISGRARGFIAIEHASRVRRIVARSRIAATSPTVAEARELPDDGVDRQRRVDFVVVAYRSERHLGGCLDAIAADRPPDASVIVVDNASPDRSADVARTHPSHPRVIASTRNLGFGGACNLAVDASDADVLFFVNPDARLAPGVTAGLLAAIEADHMVAAAGPRTQDAAAGLRAASAGFEPSLRSVLGHFLLLARLPAIGRFFPPLQLPFGSPAQQVDWVGGAALMVRRDAFRSVGGFDQSFFLYMEDVDLCRRLRADRWTIRYEPGVEVQHDLGGSQGPEQAARWFTAFHAYLVGQRGGGYARVASAAASVGLAMRAVVLAARRPGHARRLARAAGTAAHLALGVRRPAESAGEE
jgi:GT2 family glycosyltransferase